jgi:D-beta-D-heptose 7-phosphate kinase/D-beta-D-heptose 1-phosphate adenosyltransferase
LSGSRRAELEVVLDRMTGLRVLVVGDVMLDEYRIGAVARISPEAPVPIVRVEQTRLALGGAGNVARNLVALGVATRLVGTRGDDREGQQIDQAMATLGLPSDGLVVVPDRPTTHKLRVVAQSRQMLRLDREETAPLPAPARARVEAAALAALDDCDALLLIDYDKGLFGDGLAGTLVAAARARGIFVAADPKHDLARFRAASLVKPNWAEACAAVDGGGAGVSERRRLLEKLRARLGGAEIVVTRGGEGACALGADGRMLDVPTRRRAVFDVQGAGDTAMAALAGCRAAGASLLDACLVANAAASVAVGKLGTAAVSRAELAASLDEAFADAAFVRGLEAS